MTYVQRMRALVALVAFAAVCAGGCYAAMAQSETPDVQSPPVASLTSMLRNAQTARPPRNQMTTTTTNTSPATQTPFPLSLSSSTTTPSVQTTTTTTNKLQTHQQQQASSSSSSQSQVITTTPVPNIAPNAANAAAADGSDTNNKFQYVKPMSLRCQHNNQTYSIGQSWNDDCLQICECVSNGDPMAPLAISACRNRCPTYKDPPGDGCSLQRSKSDECCLDWVCDSEAKLAISSTTVMNTERGQLNVSTTEIKFPSTSTGESSQQQQQQQSVSGSALAQPSSSSQVQITTTQTPPTTLATMMQQTKVINKTTTATSKAQVPTTTTIPVPDKRSSQAATTITPPQAAITTTTSPTVASSSANNRNPKAAPGSVGGLAGRSPDEIVTRTPSSLPAPKSWVTTTNQPPQTRSNSVLFEEPRVAASLPSATTTTTTTSTTTTTTPPPPPTTITPADELNSGAEDEVNPLDLDLCIIRHSDAYRVNQSWLEEPCKQTCRCVFRSEPRDPISDVRVVQTANMRENSEQTEIRCGLPAQCYPVAMKLIPSPECPSPKLIVPQSSLDKCACPRVSCGLATTTPKQLPAATVTTTTTTVMASQRPSNSNPRTTTPSDASVTSVSANESSDELPPPPTGCRAKQNGRLLNFGDTFNDECHSTCRCFADSEIRCQPLVCPPEPQADPTNCTKWVSDPSFRANSSEGKCCPQHVCKEPVVRMRSCHMMGKETQHGERLPEEIQPRTAECEKACHCNDGKIICQPVCPPLGDTPPEDLNCQPEQAYKTSDECCPKWSCPITEEYALQGFDVVPLNATSVEVSFVLPLFAVGRKGRAELNYTGIPVVSGGSGSANNNELTAASASDMPPVSANWIRKTNIRTTDGIFVSQSIKYHLNNLKPAHKYWFKLVVYFQNEQTPLDDPLESPLQRVIMPPLNLIDEEESSSSSSSKIEDQRIPTSSSSASSGPVAISSTTTSTTTTSTTTLAPPPQTRMLKPKHNPSPVPATQATGSRPPSPSPSPATPPTSTTSTTTTSTTTTTTEQPPSSSSSSASSDQLPAENQKPLSGATIDSSEPSIINMKTSNNDIVKPDISNYNNNNGSPSSPCSTGKSYDNNNNNNNNNGIDDRSLSLAWTDQIHTQMNGPIQKYAWHLLVGFLTMTLLFTIVSFMYLKKSSRVIAPITSKSAYDNPSFTKLKSYNPQTLLIDETSHQNYSNDVILARQKNLEVDQASPFHNNNNHHQLNDLHHHNGRQCLI